MSRDARRAILSFIMFLTFVGTFLITLPMAQRYTQAKNQQTAATH